MQSFRPEDAREVAVALLANSETLINSMNERAQKEALDTASREVTQTRERARLALDRITEFRRRNVMIDPGRVSTAALETITKLALEIASTNAELSELKRASREMGFGDDWKKALEKVKSTYVPRGEQPALVRDLAQARVVVGKITKTEGRRHQIKVRARKWKVEGIGLNPAWSPTIRCCRLGGRALQHGVRKIRTEYLRWRPSRLTAQRERLHEIAH